MLSCCIYMSLKCSAMKVKIIMLLSLVCVFSADLMGAQTKEDRFRKKFPYKYEFRIGWAGYPSLDADNHIHLNDRIIPSFLDGLYSPKRGPEYMTGIIYGEFSIHFKRWFTLSVIAGVNGMWGRMYYPVDDEWSPNRRGAVVTLLPVARFNWVNARAVRLYSSAGLGISGGGFGGSNDCYAALQVTPIGITLGRKFFVFGECSFGTAWLGGNIGLGYRF